MYSTAPSRLWTYWPDQIRIKELLARLNDGTVEEVIMATNPTVQGRGHRYVYQPAAEAHGHYCQPPGLRRSGGAELEYADEVTLSRALEGRSLI